VFDRGRSLTESVSSGVVELTFGRGDIDFAKIENGSQVWKTDDPQMTQRLRKSFHSSQHGRQQPIGLKVFAAVGEPLKIAAMLSDGRSCEIVSDTTLQEAKRHPLTQVMLEEQFSRLGGTPFMLRDVAATIEGNPMAPFSVLGSLRKRLVLALEKLVSVQPTRHRQSDIDESLRNILKAVSSGNKGESFNEVKPVLHVMVRTLPQLNTVLQLGEKNLMADFSDIRQYRTAVELAQQEDAQLFIATPRIQKPSELGVFASLVKCEPSGVLVRNFSGLEYFRDRGIPVTADFSLNATNPLTVDFFKQEGVERIAVSYDCNREQLIELTTAVPAGLLEVVIHQHMPMFHMEHCVFCAVLSPGTNKTNCGRPCDDHVVQLRDRIAVDHPLTADVGCRNTLFNAVPQSGAEAVRQLIRSGVKHLRVEMLHQDEDETVSIINMYRKLLSGEVTGNEVWNKLKAANRVGVTRGTLEERRNPLAIL
jgi:putative protease